MPLLTDKLTELAGTLANLKDRVRAALAGELARVVADAVRDVVQAVLRREPGATEVSREYYPTGRPLQEPVDPWAEEPDAWDRTNPDPVYRREPDRPAEPDRRPDAALALSAGVAVARWWARRTGRIAAGIGVGLLVAAIGATGPVGRAVIAAVASAVDILAVPDLLSAAADRLGRW